jgi:hypothetical protein
MLKISKILIGLIYCFFWTSFLHTQPIAQYELTIQNPQLIGSIYQFDLYIKSIGITNFRLGNSQFIFGFDSSQFLAPTIVRLNSSEEIGSDYFIDQMIDGNQIRISLCGNGSYQNSNLISSIGNGIRISTFQIANVNAEILSAGLTWINKPQLIRTGVSKIDSLNNYYDITDESGVAHIDGGSEFASIYGYVFNDLNRNGVWNHPSEPGLNGWSILLDGPNGHDSSSSGAGNWFGGYFEFHNLTPGNYQLTELLQNGWYQTTSPSKPILLYAGQVSENNYFGNYLGFATQMVQQFHRGWNLFSLPLNLFNPTLEENYSTAISPAYKYTGGYERCDSLKVGSGYWLKMGDVSEFVLWGDFVYQDTVQVAIGWNLIGSISESLLTSSITSDPPGIVTSSFYCYNSGYQIADTIQPGKGYWVKVNQPGSLILSSQGYKKHLR